MGYPGKGSDSRAQDSGAPSQVGTAENGGGGQGGQSGEKGGLHRHRVPADTYGRQARMPVARAASQAGVSKTAGLAPREGGGGLQRARRGLSGTQEGPGRLSDTRPGSCWRGFFLEASGHTPLWGVFRGPESFELGLALRQVDEPRDPWGPFQLVALISKSRPSGEEGPSNTTWRPHPPGCRGLPTSSLAVLWGTRSFGGGSSLLFALFS